MVAADDALVQNGHLDLDRYSDPDELDLGLDIKGDLKRKSNESQWST
jgi:hypothetical protein